MTPRVIVAGAGVAGLSTALALERAGIEVLVLERQDGPSEVAAGLQLWFNGVTAAEALGVADALRARGTPLVGQRFASASGKVLVDIPLAPLARRLGLPDPISVDRRLLQTTLADALQHTEIRYNAPCAGFVQEGEEVVVYASPAEERGSLLVIADGATSDLRPALVRARLVPAGYQYLRGVIGRVDHEALPPSWFYVAFGRGARFGTVEIGDRRVVFGSFPAPVATGDPPEGRKADFARRFSDFAQPVGELIERAGAESPIARSDVVDIDPLERWTCGRAVMVGDAAHAMTPNQGRGASEAMQDGIVLADRLRGVDLAKGSDLEPALRSFEHDRHPPTKAVQEGSRRAGKLIVATNPLFCRVRDGLVLRHMFKRKLLRDIEREFAPSTANGS